MRETHSPALSRSSSRSHPGAPAAVPSSLGSPTPSPVRLRDASPAGKVPSHPANTSSARWSVPPFFARSSTQYQHLQSARLPSSKGGCAPRRPREPHQKSFRRASFFPPARFPRFTLCAAHPRGSYGQHGEPPARPRSGKAGTPMQKFPRWSTDRQASRRTVSHAVAGHRPTQGRQQRSIQKRRDGPLPPEWRIALAPARHQRPFARQSREYAA